MKSLRQKILIAVASGCINTRQVAKYLGVAHGVISNCLYVTRPFINGDVLRWDPGKGNTLRLGPNAAVVRDKDDNVIEVGRAEKVERWKDNNETNFT